MILLIIGLGSLTAGILLMPQEDIRAPAVMAVVLGVACIAGFLWVVIGTARERRGAKDE